MITQIAPTRATILIEGESGTGKELVAHAIHNLSGRPKEKIVTVNCAALSSQLLESELFGHEKGAFTGASSRRIGRIEQANGGTLFLDEIGEIDAATQVKLLRVLSERTIERVGSNTPIKVDVRFVTATNKNLRKMVGKGDFREDLFFRLNVVKIEMPALRAREEDVILLANSFLTEFSEENKKSLKPLSDSAIQLLQHYQWPGSNDDMITPSHLPAIIRTGGLGNLTSDPQITSSVNQSKNNLADKPEFNLHALETMMIKKAMEYSNENRTTASKLLGISRRTLQRKLKELES